MPETRPRRGAVWVFFFLWFPPLPEQTCSAKYPATQRGGGGDVGARPSSLPGRGRAAGAALHPGRGCGGGGRGERPARKAGRELPISGKPSAAETPTKWRRRTERPVVAAAEAGGGTEEPLPASRRAAAVLVVVAAARAGPNSVRPRPGSGRCRRHRLLAAGRSAVPPWRGGGQLRFEDERPRRGRSAGATTTSAPRPGRPGRPGPFSPRRERAGRGRGRRCLLRFPRWGLAPPKGASRPPGNGCSAGAAGPVGPLRRRRARVRPPPALVPLARAGRTGGAGRPALRQTELGSRPGAGWATEARACRCAGRGSGCSGLRCARRSSRRCPPPVGVVLETLGPAVLSELPWYRSVATQLTLWSSAAVRPVPVQITLRRSRNNDCCY